jgi:hypothetical protein
MREFLICGSFSALEKMTAPALLLTAAPAAEAAEDECSQERIVYVLQGRDDEIRFEGIDLVYRSDGTETRYETSGNGTGISVRSAYNPDVPEYMNGEYFEVDISDYAKPGAPKYLLIFHNSVFIPECR